MAAATAAALCCAFVLARGGQAVVGAGLLAAVAGAAGQGKRGGVPMAGPAGLAGGPQGFPGPVERVRLPFAVIDLPAQCGHSLRHGLQS